MIAFEETTPQAKQENDNLKATKMKMDEIRQENNRLKLTLSQMIKDYNSLKDSVHDHQDRPKKSTDSSNKNDSDIININLSLGSHQYPERDEDSRNMNRELKKHQDSSCNNEIGDGLELGLDSKFTSKAEENPSPENSGDRHVRSPKTSRNGEDDHVHELQSPLKKTRVSVRAVCAAQTMHDGCQWRKYGQKISKGNPCPRAYYRCTVSPTCPVRKQVQRCVDNMSILTTTYEGTHDHPLPPSAASMASATSAAATMLSCGSSNSSPVLELSSTPSHNNNNTNLLGFNFMSSSMIQRASISTTSQSHPTVILDLTKPNQTMTSSAPFNNKLLSSSSSSVLLSNPNSCLSFSNPNPRDSSAKPFVYDKERENIMRDPTFQSALKAAITSIVGANYNEKLGENFHLSFSQPSFENGSAGGVRNWSQLWNMS